MRKYKNEWDVTLRDSGILTSTGMNQPGTVRVEGSYYVQDGGYLIFQFPTEDPKDFSDFTVTAIFPHQNVSKVVRIEEELTKEGLLAQSEDNLLDKGSCRTGCGCA